MKSEKEGQVPFKAVKPVMVINISQAVVMSK
jgi:hypothetical protein